jgi:hypothetical protein
VSEFCETGTGNPAKRQAAGRPPRLFSATLVESFARPGTNRTVKNRLIEKDS